jgi:hypothetical protein
MSKKVAVSLFRRGEDWIAKLDEYEGKGVDPSVALEELAWELTGSMDPGEHERLFGEAERCNP